jgi:ATP-dependent DNA ligase
MTATIYDVTEGHGEKLFEAVCDLGLEGIVSKRLTAAPAATRAMDGTF